MLSLSTDSYYLGEFALGDFFLIEYPHWSESEKYDFNWSDLKKEKDRFYKINYDNLMIHN